MFSFSYFTIYHTFVFKYFLKKRSFQKSGCTNFLFFLFCLKISRSKKKFAKSLFHSLRDFRFFKEFSFTFIKNFFFRNLIICKNKKNKDFIQRLFLSPKKEYYKLEKETFFPEMRRRGAAAAEAVGRHVIHEHRQKYIRSLSQ